MSRSNYRDHIQSAYWREVRKAIYGRSGGTCERCSISAAEHVHHMTYRHLGREHEHLDDLQHLCGDCHRLAHGRGTYDPRAVMGDRWYEVLTARLRTL